ncbi:MAG: hypothetical protein GF329_01830 [Candidatus Lokiarchaeota archaeon]|nr:hypothetical protein [Candidatus Lokiarchaeota archaeon]
MPRNCVKNQIYPIDRIKEWGKIYKSQRFRIVGRFTKYRYRYNALRTPFHSVERFKIFKKDLNNRYGEFFP